MLSGELALLTVTILLYSNGIGYTSAAAFLRPVSGGENGGQTNKELPSDDSLHGLREAANVFPQPQLADLAAFDFASPQIAYRREFEDTYPDTVPLDKRAQTFVRFGKRAQAFVRFGKRAQTFVRFG